MRRLEINALLVGYATGFKVGPVSLQVDAGLIHLTGANGTGKTTLLRAMCGEIPGVAGSVTVNGEDVHRQPSARRDIALVPARNELPEFLSVREAYEFAASLRRRSDWCGLAYCKAMDLDPDLTIAHASDGQRRKAELIAALAGDPSVLLLDETFATLDTAGATQLASWISEWITTRVVIVTHHGELPLPPSRELALE